MADELDGGGYSVNFNVNVNVMVPDGKEVGLGVHRTAP